MFNDFEQSTLLKSVFEARFSEEKSSEVILSSSLQNVEFGQGFFQKILNKSILKPGSLKEKSETVQN